MRIIMFTAWTELQRELNYELSKHAFSTYEKNVLDLVKRIFGYYFGIMFLYHHNMNSTSLILIEDFKFLSLAVKKIHNI